MRQYFQSLRQMTRDIACNLKRIPVLYEASCIIST